jgi:hypothetical protein
VFDWDRFESELFDALVAAVGEGRWRAVALSDLYAEEAGVIAAPCLSLNPDGESYVDDWAPDSWMEALTVAVAAPYTSFRDGDAHPVPLNYQALEDFLIRYAETAPDVADELAPGRGYCTITPAEVDEALRGTASPHTLIRKHAVIVLGEPNLGDAARERVIPVLHAAAESDPDAEVRRLAGLSLQWWHR